MDKKEPTDNEGFTMRERLAMDDGEYHICRWVDLGDGGGYWDVDPRVFSWIDAFDMVKSLTPLEPETIFTLITADEKEVYDAH